MEFKHIVITLLATLSLATAEAQAAGGPRKNAFFLGDALAKIPPHHCALFITQFHLLTHDLSSDDKAWVISRLSNALADVPVTHWIEFREQVQRLIAKGPDYPNLRGSIISDTIRNVLAKMPKE